MKLLLLPLLFMATIIAQVDYLDQVNWSGVCTTGTQQSPRDLINPTDRSDVSFMLQGTTWLDIQQDSAITYFWKYDKTEDNMRVTIEFSGTLSSGECSSATYTAQQFHFHRTAQHQLSTVYKTAEMHIVFTRDADYASCSNMKGYMALGVLFQQDSTAVNNEFLERVGIYGGKRTFRAQFKKELFDWFYTDEGVFFYQGSLTTPGCVEDVFWVISKKVQSMSSRQKLYFDNMGTTSSRRDIQTPSTPLYLLSKSKIKDGRAVSTAWWYWPAIFIPLALGVGIITFLLICIITAVKKRKLRREKSFEEIRKRIRSHQKVSTREDADSSDFELR